MPAPIMDINQIKKLLPHRYPFLLVDKVVEHEPGKRIVAIKNVTSNEEFFNGHFPENPVMPGVLQLEALAQAAGLMMAGTQTDLGEKKLVLFGGANDVRFRKPVLPGDTLELVVELIKVKGPFIKALGKANVAGELACEAEITLAIAPNKPVASAEPEGLVHPTAVIHPTAKLGANVKVGAYTIIKANVVIGDNNVIDDHVVIDENTIMGADNHIHYGAIIGDLPQDIKFSGETSGVKIGNRNQLREYVTINRATGDGNYTSIGDDNLIMSHVHLAHNVQVGSEVAIVSMCQIAGHVKIEDQVVIGGMVGIPQFLRIGRMAMIGGYARLYQDIPPFMLCGGNPAEVSGINIIGLKRRKISPEAIDFIKTAYKLIYRGGLNTSQALEKIKTECVTAGLMLPEIQHMVDFIEKSTKGINRKVADDEESAENAFLGMGNPAGFFDRMKGIFKKS
jgi:UDP-N-acetylglucosamine acyltransferase